MKQFIKLGVANTPSNKRTQHRARDFLFDLLIYISVMFLVRQFYFTDLNFIVNGLLMSLTTLVFAYWRMQARQVSWQDLGLCKPENYRNAVLAMGFAVILSIALIMLFKTFLSYFEFDLAPDMSNEHATGKFGDLKGNWLHLFIILPFIWLESALEEILDRGFLLVWIEKMFSSLWFATLIAVVLQAMIFGFRHSNDFSERSITVGLIGLAMGITYIAFNRNLWPIIGAHCLLNTQSMIDRVV